MKNNFDLKKAKFILLKEVEDFKDNSRDYKKLTADDLKYPFIDDTKHAILDKEYCDKIGINYNVGDEANIGDIVFKVIKIIEPYFYLLQKQESKG